MDALRNKVFQIETSIIRANLPLTLENVKDKLNDRESSNTLINLINKFDTELRKNITSGQYSESTYLKYQQSDKHIRTYLKSLGKNDITMDNVNPSFIKSYFDYLLTAMQNNSAIMILSKLKRVINYGLSFNYILSDPFIGISFHMEKTETDYLTEAEVNRIALLEIEDKELNQIRDVFVFSCLTGLSYIDCVKLRKRDIHTGLKSRFIIKKRQKTGIEQRIPLLLLPERILEKYHYTLPVPSNQKYNKKLKEIAKLAGITKELHTHVGRHTAATLLLNNKISLEAVAKILGHSDTKMTAHYANLLDSSIETEIEDNLKYKFA
jgi:site-specific recombinase XerD